jgi:hypothetical protein
MTNRAAHPAVHIGGFRFERRYLPVPVWLYGAMLVTNASLLVVSLMT